MSDKKSRLLLVDGSAVLHRAFHAMPDLTDRKGRPAGAVLGFMRMLLRAIEDLKPTAVVVAFDRKEPTFRKELFIGYQAQRPVLDPALGEQFGTTRELLTKLEIPVLDKAGFEADDILGTLCEVVNKGNHKEGLTAGSGKHTPLNEVEAPSREGNPMNFDDVVVVTGDKDLMQLVNEKVKLFMPVKGVSEGTLIDESGVVEKLGVRADQVVDLKALIGDSSDNYPGVPGVGPKTAQKLLGGLDSFEKIYAFLELNNFQSPISNFQLISNELSSNEIKKVCTQSVLDKLKLGRESGELSRQLATIRRDVEIEINWQQAKDAVGHMGKWSPLVSEFGFKKLAEDLAEKSGEQLGLEM